MVKVLTVDDSLDGQRFKVLTAAHPPVQSLVQDVGALPVGTELGQILMWDGSAFILVAGGANTSEVLFWDGTQWTPGGNLVPAGTTNGQLSMWDGTKWVLIAQPANVNDVLTWDGSIWAPAAAAGGVSAWDTVVQVKADLPAPVGGIIDLTSGSFAFKNAISLGSDRIRVAAGQSVLLKGMGATKILSGSGSSIIEVLGDAIIETLVTLASSGPAVVLGAGGRLRAVSCVWESNTDPGLQQTGGQLDDTLSGYDGGTHAYQITGGESHLEGCNLTAGNMQAVNGSGSLGTLGVTLNGCRLLANTATTVVWNVTNADLSLIDTNVRCEQANGTCIEILAASGLAFIGGKWSTDFNSRGDGLVINGNITGGLQIVGVSGDDISSSDISGEAFVRYTSGTVRRATMTDCNTTTTVSTSINWPSANIPTLGLSIVGCMWDDPTPYAGFTELDARVNVKANMDQGGQMSETPIVP